MKRSCYSCVILLVILATWMPGSVPHADAGGPLDEITKKRARMDDPVKNFGNDLIFEEEFREGELLVKFRENVTKSNRDNTHKKHRAKKIKEFRHHRIDRVRLARGMEVKEAARLYMSDPSVEYAEPNYSFRIEAIPNDPMFSQLWALQNTGQTGGMPGADIDAPTAWDITTGDSSVVVAVIDTGIDYNHEDLAQNIWVNDVEQNGVTGVDDDANGYVDDIYGIDTSNADADPFDDHGHGTHVAGTIGAVGDNGVGMTGVDWNINIMSCKFLDAAGYGSTSGAIECLEYIKDMKDRGVKVVATSNSWGGSSYSSLLRDTINAQGDILFIAAAGNSSSNNDQVAHYPCNYDLPNVIAVAATDANEALAYFSSYGSMSVDVAAPGVQILSTLPAQNRWGIDGGYGQLSGTSMATPHVSGLAALIKAEDPLRDWREIKNLILSGGDSLPSLKGITLTEKGINAIGSLSCSNQPLIRALKHPPFPISAGTPATFSVQSINCGFPSGPVTANTSEGENFELYDNGVAPDVAVGDGIFSGTWTPSIQTDYIVFSAPSGSLTVPALSITSHYPGEANIYSSYYRLLEAAQGTPPLVWSVAYGSLPDGLGLDPVTGEISGIPTAAGTYWFVINVQDAVGRTGIQPFTILVSDDHIVELQAETYDGTSDEGPYDIALDQNGNIYVTGYKYDNLDDFLTVKYDASFNLLWSRTYNSKRWNKFHNNDRAMGVDVDSSGNVYVAGGSSSGSVFSDIKIIKYDPAGNVVWETSYGGDDYEFAEDVAVDNNDNVYVTGFIMYADERFDVLTVKYTSTGDLVWARTHNGTDKDRGYAIAVDGTGNVYVTGDRAPLQCGTTGCQFSSLNKILTLKYDPAGNLLWARDDNSFNYGAFTGTGIDVDADGNAYVLGYYVSTIGATELIKYDSSGTLIWRAMLQGNGDSIAVGPNGDVYVAGSYYENWEHKKKLYFISRFTSSGDEVWTRPIDGKYQSLACALAVDGENHIYVARTFDGANDEDILLSKYQDTLLYNQSISVSPTAFDFGTADPGMVSPAQRFTVTNSGSVDVQVGRIVIGGKDASDFGLLSDTCSNQTITSSGSCTVDAVFSPASIGNKSASLDIPADDPATPYVDWFDLPLTAIGSRPDMATAATLPRTGQTTIYTTGDDGDYQVGRIWPNPRFSANNDGTITDNLTGLMWLKDGSCMGYFDWDAALARAADFNSNPSAYNCQDYIATHTNWRVPNANELWSLVDAGQPDIAAWLNTQGFAGVVPAHYWSSTTPWADEATAVTVSLHTPGDRTLADKIGDFHSMGLLLVRTTGDASKLFKTGQTTSYASGDDGDTQAGLPWPEPRFVDNGNGTVTDRATQLMWIKNLNGWGSRSWQDVFDQLAAFNGESAAAGTEAYNAGYSDWRVPNVNELARLLAHGLWLDTTPGQSLDVFEDLYGIFWTSTTDQSSTDYAFQVRYGWDFPVQPGLKTEWDGASLWPVRSVTSQSDISVSPLSQDFGILYLGALSPPQTFTVLNTGAQDLALGAITLSGGDAEEFSFQSDNCSNQILAPLTTCDIEVAFGPVTAGTKNATIAIPSNDPDTPSFDVALQGLGKLPGISIDDVTVSENASTADFTANLSATGTGLIQVQYATADGSAAAGSDYTAASGYIVFNPGVTSQPISVQLINDAFPEEFETFSLILSNVTGEGEIVDGQAVGTIVDDDVAISAAMGPNIDNESRIKIFDTNWTELSCFTAFDAARVRYGARVSLGDIDGDGMDEVLVTKGEGAINNTELKAYETDGTPITGANFVAFSSAYRNGARVAVADFDGDGKDEIIVGTSAGRPIVRILSYSVTSMSMDDTGLIFNPFPGYSGGVNVAAADLDGDGIPELVTSPSAKHVRPELRLWTVDTAVGMGGWAANPYAGSFLLPSPANLMQNATGGGAAIAAGNNMLAIGSGEGGGRVEIYSGADVYDCRIDLEDVGTRQRSGIELAIGDTDGDGAEEVLVTLGQSPYSGTVIQIYDTNCIYENTFGPVFPGATHGARTAVDKK